MRSLIHAFFAIFAAIFTIVAVFAIKQGVEWGLVGVRSEILDIIIVVMLAVFGLMATWTYLLRPMIDRRQQ